MLKTRAAETEIQKEGEMHQESWRQLPKCQTLPQADTIAALSLWVQGDTEPEPHMYSYSKY